MPAQTLLSVDEYLHASFGQDKDYVNGELLDRGMPTFRHSQLQVALGAYLFFRCAEWRIFVGCDVHVRISGSIVRIADICAIPQMNYVDGILEAAPLFVIEILSPDNPLAGERKRALDYLRMGVQHVWTIDPVSGECYEHQERYMIPVEDRVLRVAGTAIEIPIDEVRASICPT